MATYPIKMLRDEDRQPFIPFTNVAAVVDANGVTLQELMDNGKYKIQNNVTTSQAGKGILDAYQGKVLNDKFSNYVPLSQKGVANGVATLDGDAKVPTAQLPSYVDDVIEAYTRSGATALSSTWLSLTDGGAALTPEKGKIYVIMSSGSYQNKQYRWGGSTYVLCNPSDVNSVNGFTGVVVLKELTIQKNGTQVGDKFNGSANKTINITVPTKTSDITNNSGFITAADDITGNAATATNATNDANGNKIDTTYVKKAGDTMTGGLTFQVGSSALNTLGIQFANGGSIGGNTDGNVGIYSNGTLYFRPSSTSTTDGIQVTTTGLIPNGGTAANLGTSTNKWGTVYATTFNGTATSATQDGSGNVITDTYVKKAGDTMTGDLTLSAAAATDSPSLIFQRGTLTDNYNDWKINDRGGTLYFDQRGNGSSSWSNIISIDTSGKVTANTFVGSLQGNANTATKATEDKNGLDITNYIKGLSVNGKVITYTKGDNTTGTITTQDTIYTLPVAGTGVNGTLGGIKVGSGLSIDAGTGVLSATGGGTADSVEWSGVLNKPTTVSYWTNDSGYITLANVMAGATASTAGTAGVVPAPGSGSQAKFLRGDGQWADVSTTDTKNTTGTTNTTSKIYLAGATEQSANPQTYSNVNCYASGGKLYSNSKEVVNLSDTQSLTNKTYNGYTLAAACAKGVVTTVDTSANLPTSNAVKTFVEGKGYVTTDTKNTAGSTDTSSKIFLIGATSQAANPQTYSDNEIYVTSGVLTTKSVQVGGTAATIQYNSTDKCIEFVFA